MTHFEVEKCLLEAGHGGLEARGSEFTIDSVACADSSVTRAMQPGGGPVE